MVVGVSLLALAGGVATGLEGAGAAPGSPGRTAAVQARVTTAPAHRPRPSHRVTTSRPATGTRTTSAPPTSTSTTATRTSATSTTATRTSATTTAQNSGTSTTSTGAATTGVTQGWAATSAPADYLLAPRGSSTVQPGRAADGALDGKAVALTIPAGAGATPDNAAEVESRRTFRSGTFSSRVRTPDCSGQRTTGAVTGMFTYGNDGRDHDGDGIVDNSELDVEILCAAPQELNLTIWTDYNDSDGAQRRVTRVVDLRAGRVVSTGYCTDFSGDCRPLSGAEATPASVAAVPGFDSSAAFHDYRIDWSPDRVVFTVTVDGRDVVLWDYRGPTDRIPQGASSYLVNLWHTDDWSPTGLTARGAPTAPLTALVDSTTVPAS